MGLGDPDMIGDGGGGVGSVVPAGGAPNGISCSICLELVMDGGERSTAQLQCGHQFHLDCIGSAFNAKGVMQCPNCRKIEKGNWLYSNGHRSFLEFNMDDWTHDEDFYDITYSEMPFGVHFCPFSRLARPSFSYEDSEYTSSQARYADNDLVGQSALYGEYPGTSYYHHICPYMGNIHQPPPSLSSGTQVSTDVVPDASGFRQYSNNIPVPVSTDVVPDASGFRQYSNNIPVPSTDISNSHTFRAVDSHYQSWNSHSQFSNHVNGEQAVGSSPPSTAMRFRPDAHPSQMYAHSFAVGQGSGSRASNSATISVLPHFGGNSQAHPRENHGSFLPSTRGVPFARGSHRYGSTRGLAQAGPTPPSEHPGFYIIPHVPASSRTHQEMESGIGNHLYAWERDRLAPFPLLPVDRDFTWWGQAHQTTFSSDSSNRTGFRTRHSSERSSSQAHPPPHHPRMHPFI